MLKKLAQYLIGLLVLTLGIGLIIKSGLGTGAWDSVFVGMQKHLGLTVGTWSFIIQVAILLVNAILVKEKPEWLSFLTIFLRGALLDFWMFMGIKGVVVSSLPGKCALLVIGTLLLGFGIGLYLSSQFPKSPIDGLMLALHQTFKWSIKLSRTVVELFAVIVGFLLGGPVGLGTIIITFLLGHIVQLSLKLTERIINKQTIQA
jgi:uncharacterized membrane protein YczE